MPISLTAGIPLGQRFGIFGKAGGRLRAHRRDGGPERVLRQRRKNGWGWTYGVGATFAVSQTVQLRADWDRYKLDFVGGRRDVDMLTAGLQVRF